MRDCEKMYTATKPITQRHNGGGTLVRLHYMVMPQLKKCKIINLKRKISHLVLYKPINTWSCVDLLLI